MQPVFDFIAQNAPTVLAVLVVALYILKDYNVLKQILASIFLDVEKRLRDEATAGGPEKIAEAVRSTLALIPKRFDIVLSVLALLFGTSREDLAMKLAQVIYDKIRAQAVEARAQQ